MTLRGKKVLVLGLGDTGMSMARWLSGQGARVRVADTRDAPPHAERLRREFPAIALDRGPLQAVSFADADLIAISPGIAVAEPLVAQAHARGVTVVGDIELFARAKDPAARVVAITGSNGKSTVTTMVGAMCRAAGAGAIVAGNIGLPVLEALVAIPPPQLFVLELSSFQLETTDTLDATAATVLNISEDHLDRYHGMPAYCAAKARVFRGSGVQILNRDDALTLAMRLPKRSVVTFGLDAASGCDDWGVRFSAGRRWLAQGERLVMPAGELAVPGLHNVANALAALALCRAIGLPEQPLLQALREFKGLPHRMQIVAEHGGVVFYDDSKGTNVGATIAALNGLDGKGILIAGGDGKGQDFAPLGPAVQAKARAVVLIGKDSERIACALAGCGVALPRAASLDEAVGIAYSLASPGDAVLLSPACASYDMFRDYRHRGDEFARIARALSSSSRSAH